MSFPTLRSTARTFALAHRQWRTPRLSPTAFYSSTGESNDANKNEPENSTDAQPSDPPRPTVAGNKQAASETVKPTVKPTATPTEASSKESAMTVLEKEFPYALKTDGTEDPDELEDKVEMWNKDAPAGPEWGGPRDYEPTRFGDWAKGGRVSDF